MSGVKVTVPAMGSPLEYALDHWPLTVLVVGVLTFLLVLGIQVASRRADEVEDDAPEREDVPVFTEQEYVPGVGWQVRETPLVGLMEPDLDGQDDASPEDDNGPVDVESAGDLDGGSDDADGASKAVDWAASEPDRDESTTEDPTDHDPSSGAETDDALVDEDVEEAATMDAAEDIEPDGDVEPDEHGAVVAEDGERKDTADDSGGGLSEPAEEPEPDPHAPALDADDTEAPTRLVEVPAPDDANDADNTSAAATTPDVPNEAHADAADGEGASYLVASQDSAGNEPVFNLSETDGDTAPELTFADGEVVRDPADSGDGSALLPPPVRVSAWPNGREATDSPEPEVEEVPDVDLDDPADGPSPEIPWPADYSPAGDLPQGVLAGETSDEDSEPLDVPEEPRVTRRQLREVERAAKRRRRRGTPVLAPVPVVEVDDPAPTPAPVWEPVEALPEPVTTWEPVTTANETDEPTTAEAAPRTWRERRRARKAARQAAQAGERYEDVPTDALTSPAGDVDGLTSGLVEDAPEGPVAPLIDATVADVHAEGGQDAAPADQWPPYAEGGDSYPSPAADTEMPEQHDAVPTDDDTAVPSDTAEVAPADPDGEHPSTWQPYSPAPAPAPQWFPNDAEPGTPLPQEDTPALADGTDTPDVDVESDPVAYTPWLVAPAPVDPFTAPTPVNPFVTPNIAEPIGAGDAEDSGDEGADAAVDVDVPAAAEEVPDGDEVAVEVPAPAPWWTPPVSTDQTADTTPEPLDDPAQDDDGLPAGEPEDSESEDLTPPVLGQPAWLDHDLPDDLPAELAEPDTVESPTPAPEDATQVDGEPAVDPEVGAAAITSVQDRLRTRDARNAERRRLQAERRAEQEAQKAEQARERRAEEARRAAERRERSLTAEREAARKRAQKQARVEAKAAARARRKKEAQEKKAAKVRRAPDSEGTTALRLAAQQMLATAAANQATQQPVAPTTGALDLLHGGTIDVPDVDEQVKDKPEDANAFVIGASRRQMSDLDHHAYDLPEPLPRPMRH